MNRRDALLAVLCGLAGWQPALHAESAHEPGSAHEALEDVHQPRHGGQFGDADDLYHYELVFEAPNRLKLYVNDEQNRPLDTQRLEGRWTLNPDSAAPVRGAFTPAEHGAYFLGELPAGVHATPLLPTAHFEVEVLKGAQWVPMEFFLPLR